MSTTLPARFSLDQPGRGGGAPMATWEQIVVDLPLVAATMRTYLDQVAVVLRPGSVTNTDQCLRSFGMGKIHGDTSFSIKATPALTACEMHMHHPWS